jgi:hypothetical protein
MSATLRFSLLGGCLVVAALQLPECARIIAQTWQDRAPASRVTTTAALPASAARAVEDAARER